MSFFPPLIQGASTAVVKQRVHGFITDGPESIFSPAARDTSPRFSALLLFLSPLRVNNIVNIPALILFPDKKGNVHACLPCCPLTCVNSTLGSILDFCHLLISGCDPAARPPLGSRLVYENHQIPPLGCIDFFWFCTNPFRTYLGVRSGRS